MAIDSPNMIRRAFDTRITTLATNTTLGTATRHDFAAMTLHVPETATGRFSSANGARVFVRVGVRDAETTTATNFTGLRIGIKINAVAFDDVDFALTIANSGDHWSYEHVRDVTSYFSTNDPGTASFSVQVGVAFSTAAASLVNNITCELFVVYGVDSAAASTFAGTAVFPIQAHHVVLPTAGTFVEVGTTGGTSNAPVNQIPKLTGAGGVFDGITGFTLRQRYLIIYAQDGGASTTDFTPNIRFDGGATIARAPIEQGLSTNVRYLDIYDITSLSTSAAHSFEMDPGLNSRMTNVGALDVVTYEYTKPTGSDTCHVSVMVPLEMVHGANYSMFEVAADPQRFTATLDIEEPGTITMGQCGVVMHHGEQNDLFCAATGQTARQYDEGTASVNSGFVTIVHRTDHSSSTWSLARGVNRLTVDVYAGGAGNINSPITGYAIINYRCTRHADGAHKHNKTLALAQVVTPSLAQNSVYVTPDEPVIVPADYYIQGAWVSGISYGTTQSHDYAAQKLSGEDDGAGGFWREHVEGNGTAENGVHLLEVPCSRWFRHRSGAPTVYNGGNIESERKWHSRCNGGTSGIVHQALLFATLHSMTFTVASDVLINGVAPANGKTVEVFSVDSSGAVELLATTTTTGGTGNFTAEVPHNTRAAYFASYDNDGNTSRSLDDEPA